MTQSVPQHLGKYDLQEPLGRGGMAEVWKAFDTQLRRAVAIKFMHANLAADPDFVSRFTREAQVIAALRHPNIVQIYDFYTAGSGAAGDSAHSEHGEQSEHGASSPASAGAITAYMVMEYVKGQTLAQYIAATSRKREFPSPAAVLRLLTPISLALDYAHRQGAIHRDIKPANILLDATNTARNPMGEPILSDFGLARMLGATAQTVTGTIAGTPLYMSPEQIQGKPVSDRSDLYSLGVVLYEMFTGAPPFQADSMPGIMMQHLTATPLAPDQANRALPAALTPVLLKSLAKDPLDRYASAAELTAAVAVAFDLPIPDDLRTALHAQAVADQTVVSESGQDMESGAHSDARGTISAGQATLASNEDASLTSASARQAEPTLLAGANVAPVAPVASAARTADAQRNAAPAMQNKTPPQALSAMISRLPAPDAVRRRLGPQQILALVVVCALLIAGVGTYFLVTHRGAPTTASTNTAVGLAIFESTGKIDQNATQGINDEFAINLQGVPSPAQGKAYYAWLLPDVTQTEAPDILLGKLPVQNGRIHFLYPGDSQHTNLLTIASRFLITEESSAVTPDVPTPDLTAWRYYAQLPQTHASGQQFSLLDHLRHLLAKDPDLEALGLHGGLNIWAFRDSKDVALLAQNAKSAWSAQQYTSLHKTIVSILDFLDGSKEVGQDVPAGTPIYANPQIAQVGLLEFDPLHQNPPGYLYHISLHISGVLNSPGSTEYQRNLAVKINASLDNIKRNLNQARHDAAQLAAMDNNQLAQPSTLNLITDLISVTTNAWQGSGSQDGVAQLYVQIQRLATFSVMPYKS